MEGLGLELGALGGAGALACWVGGYEKETQPTVPPSPPGRRGTSPGSVGRRETWPLHHPRTEPCARLQAQKLPFGYRQSQKTPNHSPIGFPSLRRQPHAPKLGHEQ